MLKYYIPKTVVYINNFEPFRIKLYPNTISENIPITKDIDITWNNAEEEVNKLDSWSVPFGITKTKKGLKIFYWDDLFNNVKQWKEDLNMSIETVWIEYKPSLKEIINFPDSDKAIQYLVERGLNMSSLRRNFK